MSEPVKGAGQAALTEWFNKAQKVAAAAYPTIFFGTETPEANENERALEFCLNEYFCEPDSYMDWEGVMEAWRAWYKSCMPF